MTISLKYSSMWLCIYFLKIEIQHGKFVKGLSQLKMYGKYYLVTMMMKMGFETESSYQVPGTLIEWIFTDV